MVLYYSGLQPCRCTPQLSSDWGCGVFYSASRQPTAAVALMVHSSRSFDQWYALALLRRALSWFLAWSYFPYQRSSLGLELSTGPMIFLLISGRHSWGNRLGLLQIPDLVSHGSCSGRAVLALVRPVVPYTLELSAALSVGDVSGSGALQQHSPGRPDASPAFCRRVALRPSERYSLLSTLK